MLGAIIGDIAGCVYERRPPKTPEFPLMHPFSRYTDDTVLTIAIAKALLDNTSYNQSLYQFARAYPNRGYGSTFIRWFTSSNPQSYNSFGNGSAMRVSPIGFMAQSREWALSEAEKSASVTHNHPEGIKGAQAIALAIYLARQGASKDEIREQLTLQIGYDLSRSYEDIQPTYTFDVTCQGSVPESIIAFLASENYEDAIRKAIWLGGDADTMACIAGGIAEAYYGEIPEYLMDEAMKKLPQQFKDIITAFYQAI